MAVSASRTYADECILEGEDELSDALVGMLEAVLCLYRPECAFMAELKLEAHVNTILVHVVQLCLQLPTNESERIFETVAAQIKSSSDMEMLQHALCHPDSRSMSRHGSICSGLETAASSSRGDMHPQ